MARKNIDSGRRSENGSLHRMIREHLRHADFMQNPKIPLFGPGHGRLPYPTSPRSEILYNGYSPDDYQ
jgi:hypothetical protein